MLILIILTALIFFLDKMLKVGFNFSSANLSHCFRIFSEEKIVDAAEVNQRQYLERSGQWLENVDRTHQSLASGKVVLQKIAIYAHKKIWPKSART